ncbi:cell wall hydrolase [Profundibacter sp.]
MRSWLTRIQTAVWVFSIAVTGTFGVAAADVTISTSNDPTVQQDVLTLSNRLTLLLTNERRALSRVSVERMRVITSAPSVSLRPAARGENHAIPSVSYTRKWVANQPAASGGADWTCLSEALYFEARGESVKGQFAVAEVILNRVKSRKFPGSVCAVVNQGTGKRNRCQFSYTCDGNPEHINEPAAYRNVGKIARALLDGAPRNLTVGATYYHNHTVRPRWSRVFTRTASIDGHYFYR